MRLSVLLKDCFTGIDGESYDIGRLLWAIGVFSYIGIAIYAIMKGQPWSASEYGIGMSTILAGGGAGVAFKSKTEPKEHIKEDANVG